MPNVPYMPQSSLGIQTQSSPLLLDFGIRTTQGMVVPQRRWIPADEVGIRRHVQKLTLQLPVFFVNHDGGVGFLLTDILQGRNSNLYNRDSQPPLGGRITTHIRIDLSPQTFMLVDGTFVNILRLHSDPVIAVGNARFLQKTRDLCTESDHAWPFYEARWQFGQQILRCELLSSYPVMSLIEFLLF